MVVLNKEVSYDFKAAPLTDVLGFLSYDTQANMRYVSNDEPRPEIEVTLKLHRMPLREVLYRLAKDHDLTIEWDRIADGGPRGIRITPK